MDVKSTWIPTWHRMDHVLCSLELFSRPSLRGRPNTKPGDHDTLNAHNRWFLLFDRARGPTLIKIHWNSIWLRVWSHMTLHYTWGFITTLHNFGSVLGRWPLDTFLWALTISWSRFLAHVWSGPNLQSTMLLTMPKPLYSAQVHLHVLNRENTLQIYQLVLQTSRKLCINSWGIGEILLYTSN